MSNHSTISDHDDVKSILNSLRKEGTKTVRDLQNLVNEHNLYLRFLNEIEIKYDGLHELDKNVFVVVTANSYIVGIGQDTELDNLFAEVKRKINDIENGDFKSIGKLEVKYE